MLTFKPVAYVAHNMEALQTHALPAVATLMRQHTVARRRQAKVALC